MTDEKSCFKCPEFKCLIKECYPFWIRKISEKKTISLYQNGDIIFKKEDNVRGIFFIKNGKVKVISSRLSGEQQIVRLAGNGHILGHRGFAGETYPVSAIAMDNSEICFIDNDTVFEAFYHNLQFIIALMLFYSKELRAMEERTLYLMQMNEREKAAYCILYLKEVFGYIPSDTCDEINTNITREDFALLCGNSLKQTVKLLQDFEVEQLVMMEGNRIRVINEVQLLEMIDSYT